MKTGKLGLLSVALVVGLAACNLINPTEPVDPPVNPNPPGGGTNTGGPGTPTGGGNGGGGSTTGAPTGEFGLSESASGPFEFSGGTGGNIVDNSDPRIVSVSAGGTFYAQVAYSDSDGITDIRIDLVNSAPADLEGTLSETTPVGGFTLGAPTGDCTLGSSSTEVTCVYPISVDPATVDIEDLEGANNEFAYVFRTYVTDGDGNESAEPLRGYVNIN